MLGLDGFHPVLRRLLNQLLGNGCRSIALSSRSLPPKGIARLGLDGRRVFAKLVVLRVMMLRIIPRTTMDVESPGVVYLGNSVMIDRYSGMAQWAGHWCCSNHVSDSSKKEVEKLKCGAGSMA